VRPALVDLCQQCWDEDPAGTASHGGSGQRRIKRLALQLFQEQALLMFPDLFRTINAQRANAKGSGAAVAAV